MSLVNKNINNQVFYQYSKYLFIFIFKFLIDWFYLVQDLYNHIRIASALSIIRSKPENLSLKEYILIIQSRIENNSHTVSL